MDISLTSVDTPDGVLVIAAVRDITDRKNADTGRIALLSHVSHELRSPLSVVHQFVSLVLDDAAGPLSSDQRDLLGVAMRTIGQLRAMIDDLLQVARADSGRLTVARQDVAIGPVLDEAAAARRPIAEPRGITVGVEAGDLPTVVGDADRLRQVLADLLDNALKFTPDGGRITMQGVVHDAAVRVTVRETGCALAPRDEDRIVEQLFLSEQDTAAGRGGLGLGLCIGRDLIERQGGTIWAESTLGIGTAVWFTNSVGDARHAPPVSAAPSPLVVRANVSAAIGVAPHERSRSRG